MNAGAFTLRLARLDEIPALERPIATSARIRAFFVLPSWARRGIGRALLDRCEAAARAEGFRRCELMATLPGHKLYRAYGYEGDVRIVHMLPGGVAIEFIPMGKDLSAAERNRETR